MPAPGDQHLRSGGKAITNPFEEVQPRISEYTAQEIITLQSRLERQLGPEYISGRLGPSGGKVHYVAAEKVIQLANEIFGFNGWSSQIMNVQVDYVDENTQSQKFSLGLSVIVRVTLRDGTFHEDIGYGHMENSKSKAAAFEKAKKEGTTDGLKRALRNFGNVLGNCIYDKEYLGKVAKVRVQPPKFDVEKLHRHPSYAPIKKDIEPIEPRVIEGKLTDDAIEASLLTDDTIDDEYGDFDDADFGVADPDYCRPDEVVLPAPPITSSHLSKDKRGGVSINGGISNAIPPPQNHQQQSAAPVRLSNGQPGNGIHPAPQPQTPNGGFQRSNSGAGRGTRPPADSGPQPRPMQIPQLNQPSRTSQPSAPISPTRPSIHSENSDPAFPPPEVVGFFSAKTVAILPTGQSNQTSDGVPSPLPNLTAFNPRAESPSIRRTPGIDHRTSKPLTKDGKHVPSSSQAATTSGPKPSIMNAQVDTAKRIGAPGIPSPVANRGSFKPPGPMKRPVDGSGGVLNRTPLTDLPSNGTVGADVGGDIKRQRLNG